MPNDWFDWNGVRSTTYGIHLVSQPSDFLAEERVEFVDVPGRNGSLSVKEGVDVFNDQEVTLTCFVENMTNDRQIKDYLRGSGILRLAYKPGGYYKATITDTVSFDPIVAGYSHRAFTISIRMQPLFFHDEPSPVVLTSSPGVIVNSGDVVSYPKIIVECTGPIELTVNGETITLSATELLEDTSIVIDSEAMECLAIDEESFANQRVLLEDFPMLYPGENEVSWSGEGTVTSITVYRRARSR